MSTVTEIEAAAERLSDSELQLLEEKVSAMCAKRGVDKVEKTHLSNRDRDLFLELIADQDASPNLALREAVTEYRSQEHDA